MTLEAGEDLEDFCVWVTEGYGVYRVGSWGGRSKLAELPGPPSSQDYNAQNMNFRRSARHAFVGCPKRRTCMFGVHITEVTSKLQLTPCTSKSCKVSWESGTVPLSCPAQVHSGATPLVGSLDRASGSVLGLGFSFFVSTFRDIDKTFPSVRRAS